jgi:hypothetical protein
MESNCTLTLELGCTPDENALALDKGYGVQNYTLWRNTHTKEIVQVVRVMEYGVIVTRGVAGTTPRGMASGETLEFYEPAPEERKGPEGHVCNIRMMLYGGGHHIIGISEDKLGDKLFPKVMKSIGICRGCGQCYKIAQYSRPGELKERIKRCTNQEYADLLREKFHKMRKMDPDRYAIESFEEARRMLTNMESSKK